MNRLRLSIEHSLPHRTIVILVGAIVSVIVYVLWLYFFYQPKSRDSNVIL